MNWNSFDFFPLMGEKLNSQNTMSLDFSPSNTSLDDVEITDTDIFNQFVFDQLKTSEKKYGIGGYLEHRAIYRRSQVFATAESDFRDIHLGIDIWCEAGSPIYAPFDAVIHSFQDNDSFGNYGPTIILEHDLDGKKLFSLYGHLTRTDLDSLQVGQKLEKGEKFCHVGPFPENGDWPPHLHYQLMWDMLGNSGDFPGVASRKDLIKFSEICPDPNLIIGYDLPE